MSILSRLAPRRLRLPLRYHHRFHRREASLAAVASNQDTTVFTPVPVSEIRPAAESLFHVTIDVSNYPLLAASYTSPGQYLRLRVRESSRVTFLAIASPPSFAAERGVFEFLVKSVPGSIAELLCRSNEGDVVELSQALGRGFQIEKVDPLNYDTVLIFATGAAISPIRSLIESGLDTGQRYDIRLYYGARNLKRMAYQDKFKDWESSGVKIVPVLSEPDSTWTGESGYVQAAFKRGKQVYSPQSTVAVLCGQKAMTEEVTSILLADGVWRDKILKNF